MRTDIDRRQFLITSSACALVTAAMGPKLFAGEAGEVPKRLAVGFAPMDELGNISAASRIPAGDGGFIGRGALISVSGASGGDDSPLARRAVAVIAHYSYFDGAQRRVAPFHAWGCSRVTGCQGSPSRFTVPVDDAQAITFTIETERGKPLAAASRRAALSGDTPEPSALPVQLTVRSGDGLKLNRGFYIIVPLFDNDADPQWSRYELKTAEGRWALHDASGAPAPFEHFVLRIDYAS
jgi:hypothetical protein